MTYSSEKNGLPSVVGNSPVPTRFHGQRPVAFLRYMLDAISSWAARGDDDGVAALLERSGGRLTDSIEREMLQRRTHSNWTTYS